MLPFSLLPDFLQCYRTFALTCSLHFDVPVFDVTAFDLTGNSYLILRLFFLCNSLLKQCNDEYIALMNLSSAKPLFHNALDTILYSSGSQPFFDSRHPSLI